MKLTVQSIDYHTAGEPFRIVTGGVPPIPGASMLAKRTWAMQHLDSIRKLVVFEPRGHADMYGCFLTPPVSSDAEIGVLFFHNAGFSTACGHGTIAIVTAGLETGMLRGRDIGSNRRQVIIDVPSGRLETIAHLDGERIARVEFRNVPAFVETPSLRITLPDIGDLDIAIAYGGAFYALASASSVNLRINVQDLPRLIDVGRQIKKVVEEKHVPVHPEEPELAGIYGVIFAETVAEKMADGSRHDRNVTIFADGEVDRSPCGSGTSARLADLYARAAIRRGQTLIHESIIGTVFTGRVTEEVSVGRYSAVTTEIGGRAHRTGTHTFFLDPDDELGTGFLIR